MEKTENEKIAIINSIVDRYSQIFEIQDDQKKEIFDFLSGRPTNFTTDTKNLDLSGIKSLDTVIELLSAAHDGWRNINADSIVEDKDNQFKYLPIEFIGWDEAKEYLPYVQPFLGSDPLFQPPENYLKTAYYSKVADYLISNSDYGINALEGFSLHNLESLKIWLEACEDSPLNAVEFNISNDLIPSIAENIIKQLEERGFASDSELMHILYKKDVFDKSETDKENLVNNLLDVALDSKYAGYTDGIIDKIFSDLKENGYNSEESSYDKKELKSLIETFNTEETRHYIYEYMHKKLENLRGQKETLVKENEKLTQELNKESEKEGGEVGINE